MTSPLLVKAEHFEAFVLETLTVFQKMLDLSLLERTPEMKSTSNGTFAVSALVGISGPYSGGFVLSASEETALQIVSRILKESLEMGSQDVSDGLAELVNIIAGNGCRRLTDLGTLSLTSPTVIIGEHRVVWRSQDLPCLMMRFFESEVGPFSIELNLRPIPGDFVTRGTT